MNEKREDRENKVLIWLLLIVLIMFIIVGIIFTVTYAKYATMATSGDSARVAKWSMSAAAGNNANISIVKGNTTGSYTVTVQSESETASTYSINLSNVPQGVSATIDGTTLTAETNNATLVFEDIGSFGPNPDPDTASHTVTFSAALGVTPQTYAIPVSVTFTQTN